MTKAVMCTTCGQIVGPFSRSEAWNWCGEPCLHTAVRWRDPQKGLLEVTSLHGPEGVVVIGLNNFMFSVAATDPARTDEQWRSVHNLATKAPGYLFDKSKRDCWAVLVRPGESNDVFFMPYGAVWSERNELQAPSTTDASLTLDPSLTIGGPCTTCADPDSCCSAHRTHVSPHRGCILR